MNITPGYRSPDVEDFRALNGATFMPPGWQKPNGRSGTGGGGKRHRLPVDPADDAAAMAAGLRAADKQVQATNRGLGTPGGMFDWSPGSTGFAPSVPGAGGPFDWALKPTPKPSK